MKLNKPTKLSKFDGVDFFKGNVNNYKVYISNTRDHLETELCGSTVRISLLLVVELAMQGDEHKPIPSIAIRLQKI